MKKLLSEMILEDRENRYNRIVDLTDVHKEPILCARINYPGLDKLTSEARSAFVLLFEEISHVFFDKTIKSEIWEGADGLALIAVIADSALCIKTSAILIENNHPLGRLFDIDVINTYGIPISRKDLGETERKCMVCNEPAIECMITKKHSYEELIEVVNAMIEMQNN